MIPIPKWQPANLAILAVPPRAPSAFALKESTASLGALGPARYAWECVGNAAVSLWQSTRCCPKFWKISAVQQQWHVVLFTMYVASSQTHNILNFATLACAAEGMLLRDSV